MEELNRICEELARIAKALGADEPEIEREAARRLQEQANREAFIRSSRDFLRKVNPRLAHVGYYYDEAAGVEQAVLLFPNRLVNVDVAGMDTLALTKELMWAAADVA